MSSKYFSVPLGSPVHSIPTHLCVFDHIDFMCSTTRENPTKFAQEFLSPLFMEMIEFVPYRVEDASGRLRLATDVKLHESVDVMGHRTPWISVGSKAPVEIAFMNADHILELYKRFDLSFTVTDGFITIANIDGELITFDQHALGMAIGTALIVHLALGLYVSLQVDRYGK